MRACVPAWMYQVSCGLIGVVYVTSTNVMGVVVMAMMMAMGDIVMAIVVTIDVVVVTVMISVISQQYLGGGDYGNGIKETTPSSMVTAVREMSANEPQ